MKAVLAVAAAVAAAALIPVASAATHWQVVWVDGQVVWVATGYPADAQGYRFITDTLAPGGKEHPQPAQGSRFITDTLAPGGKAHPQPLQGSRFITDTLAPGGGPPVQVVTTGTAFSWADAGVGAATAAGSMLVLLGGALLALRRRGALPV